MPRRRVLPDDFPLKSVFNRFLAQYLSKTATLWYLPKYTLNGESIARVRIALKMLINEYEGEKWDRDLQDAILERWIEDGVVQPYRTDAEQADRTALVRVITKYLEYLGLAWIPRGGFHVTEVGLEVATAKNPRNVLEAQIAKFQYPNPVTGSYGPGTDGILPHLFLLQCIEECDGKISIDEFNLFVNLAGSQGDLQQIVTYIKAWRNLSSAHRKALKELVSDTQRYSQIGGLTSYQRAFFCYPTYLEHDSNGIRIKDARAVSKAIADKIDGLKITVYKKQEDWFLYYGDPAKTPSWFDFLTASLEQASPADAKKIVKAALENPTAKKTLTDEQVEEIKRKEIEKDIETFFVKYLDRIEPGLKLVKDGRQYITEIGRMDLLCQDKSGQYVVVEIKAGEAEDGVFGQILRYIGWIHTNLDNGANNVRGIILAGQFPERARYSRLGLLKRDAEAFIKFKMHGFQLSDS